MRTAFKKYPYEGGRITWETNIFKVYVNKQQLFKKDQFFIKNKIVEHFIQQ